LAGHFSILYGSRFKNRNAKIWQINWLNGANFKSSESPTIELHFGRTCKKQRWGKRKEIALRALLTWYNIIWVKVKKFSCVHINTQSKDIYFDTSISVCIIDLKPGKVS